MGKTILIKAQCSMGSLPCISFFQYCFISKKKWLPTSNELYPPQPRRVHALLGFLCSSLKLALIAALILSSCLFCCYGTCSLCLFLRPIVFPLSLLSYATVVAFLPSLHYGCHCTLLVVALLP